MAPVTKAVSDEETKLKLDHPKLSLIVENEINVVGR